MLSPPAVHAPFLLPKHVGRPVQGLESKAKGVLLALGSRLCLRAVQRLRIEGSQFLEGPRVVLPRGVNFSGLSKVSKRPDGATHLGGSEFYDHRSVSFVGRPCDLEDLEMHLERLREWGFNLLRLVITWEAVEHEGPKIYDDEYLKFLRALALRAGELGFWIIVDPHQDCWSRWTGGDGAPGWTLEAAGFKVSPELHSSGAAFLHQEHGDPLPSMSWPTNYDRLASATMFSAPAVLKEASEPLKRSPGLFWAGDRVAPGIKDKLQGGMCLRSIYSIVILLVQAVARSMTCQDPPPQVMALRRLHGTATEP